jgi:uncharacterized protein YidB (DUF937 family)
MKNLKILGGAGALVAAALIGGTLMSVVSAAPGTTPSSATGGQATTPTTTTPTTTTTGQPGPYCQTYLDAFAKQLGVDESALVPAAKAAADATIDQMVADGKLSQAAATALKQRIDSADGNGCGILAARWRQALQRYGVRQLGQDMFQAAATTLNLTPAQLRDDLRGGDSLKQIAKSQGVSYDTLTTAIVNAAKADLDKAVAAGKISADRETTILDRISKALQDGQLWNRPGHARNGPSTAAPSGAPAAG